MPSKRKLGLSRLKKRAPKIPDYTCTDIDNIINRLENLNEKGKTLSKFGLKILIRKLERLRTSNETLRESGIYWYGITKDLLEE